MLFFTFFRYPVRVMFLHEFTDSAVSGVENIRISAQDFIWIVKKHLSQLALVNNARSGYRDFWRQERGQGRR